MTKPPAPSTLHAAIAALRAELDKAGREIDALVEQRHLIASAAPHPSDLHQAVDNWVDALAHRYQAPLHEMLGAIIQAPMQTDSILSDGARPWLAKFLSLSSATNERIDSPNVAAGALAMVCGDSIKRALKSEVDSLLSGQPTGLPLAERRARLAELDAKIAERRAALATMRQEAAAAGVTIA